jgi:hypothetical protein
MDATENMPCIGCDVGDMCFSRTDAACIYKTICREKVCSRKGQQDFKLMSGPGSYGAALFFADPAALTVGAVARQLEPPHGTS